jgi:hypothetical protein
MTITYPTDNTAEAAYIMHEHKRRTGALPECRVQDGDPVQITISGNAAIIDDAVLDWPKSREFGFFAQLKWLGLLIKNKKVQNGHKITV